MDTALEQIPFNGMEEYKKPPLAEQSILWMAVQQGAPIDVVERLAALQQQEREYQATVAFDEALNRCQQQIGRIAPNQKRGDTHSEWADYAQLDRAIRPIYTSAGFSVTYSEVEPLSPGKVRMKATLSRQGISRDYFRQITPSTTGAKGNALVNATDADAIAASRAQRYLLEDIFNIAVGIDKEEKKGVPEGGEGLDEKTFAALIERIEGATDKKQLEDAFFGALGEAGKVGDKAAIGAFNKAKNEWFRQNAGAK